MKNKIAAILLGMISTMVIGCSSSSDDTKSQNAALSALSVSAGTLTPAFDPVVKTYTACVSNTVDSITVTADKADETASISISPNQPTTLSVGTNVITVTVTAEDGTANAYTITVTRNPLITVGVILPLNTGDRWPKDIAGFNANATDTGTKINLALSDGTTATQLADFNAMVSSGIKFILFTPVDRTDACWETALQTAHTAGITVIAYDRYIKGADLFFSFDNTEIGRMQSKWLTGKVPTGQYYVLSGDPADDNAALYKAGALEIINGHIGIAYDTGEVTGWSHDKAKQLVADYLVGHTPSAILTPNDGTAGSAALAIDASTLSVSNKAGLCAVLTGQDGELAAFQRIYKGKQGMTIVKNIDYLTKWALSICSDMASGKTVSTLANGTYQGTPSFLLTYGIDPKAVFLVDGSNLESLAKEGTLGSTWNEISGQ